MPIKESSFFRRLYEIKLDGSINRLDCYDVWASYSISYTIYHVYHYNAIKFFHAMHKSKTNLLPHVVWENDRHFETSPLVLAEMTSEERAQKFHTDAMRDSLVMLSWNFTSPNQKHNPNLDSDTSSVQNFCCRSSDVISGGKKWWHREISAVFSGYVTHRKEQQAQTTGCPKSSFVYFMSMYFSTIGLGKQII